MGHSTLNFDGRRLGIIAALLVAALLAVYVFNVSWNVIGTLGLLGLLLLMHGGHGGHGAHGGHSSFGDENNPRDEHAGHSASGAGSDGARTMAADSNARGVSTTADAQTTERKESHRHGGC